MTYCEYVKDLPDDNLHRIYHDTQYGFPINDDNELFGRLILEINQAGLSWDTILKKQDNFRTAYDDFNIRKVANYGVNEVDRLLNDAGIIRNKLKVNAAIQNANAIIKIQKEHGSFMKWLEMNRSLLIEDWVKLFKKKFKFTGGEITKEFLMSTGYIDGAHTEDCHTYKIISKSLHKQ